MTPHHGGFKWDCDAFAASKHEKKRKAHKRCGGLFPLGSALGSFFVSLSLSVESLKKRRNNNAIVFV